MQTSQFTNIAFISYKREDEEWAKWLQKKLEHYKLPAEIQKQNPDLEFAKNPRHVFKDTTDLSGGVLAKAIKEGLYSSKFLIVICSPRAAQSEWVCKEVQDFIDSGREEYIIPFIIDGEPYAKDSINECFPAALKGLAGERELLGININENGRDMAVVKVIARMFDVRFDALWQRFQREDKRRRRYTILGLITTILLIGTVAAYIWLQNSELDRRNQQIETQYSELQAKNNLLIEETKTISCLQDDSRPYSFVGDLRGHGGNYITDVAYHPHEGIIAFADIWGVWLHNLNTNTEVLLQDYDITNAVCYFNKTGDKLVVESMYGIFVWNVLTASLLCIYSFDSVPSSFETDFELGSSNPIMDVSWKYENGILNIYDPNANSSVCTTRIDLRDSDGCGVVNPVYPEVAFVGNDKIALYDKNKRTFVQFFQGYRSEDVSFSPSGEYLRIANNIFYRTNKVDTIKCTQIVEFPKASFPKFNEVNQKKDILNNATICISDSKIIYKKGKIKRDIQVVKAFTTGNGGEWLGDAIFAGPDKIVAIVNQGLNRVYSTETFEEIGYLSNWMWLSEESLGREEILGHAEAYIYYAKCINRKLFVVSSAGVLRIYNVDKLRQENVLEFPVSTTENKRLRTLDNCFITDDGKCIYYSFEDGNYYYKCVLPQ